MAARRSFKKRARAKDVTKYSSVDKAAIFCGIPGSFQSAPAVKASEDAAVPLSLVPEPLETIDESSRSGRKERKEKKDKKKSKKKRAGGD